MLHQQFSNPTLCCFSYLIINFNVAVIYLLSNNFYEKVYQRIFIYLKNNLVILGSGNIIKFKLRISILYFTKESHVLKKIIRSIFHIQICYNSNEKIFGSNLVLKILGKICTPRKHYFSCI